MSIKIQVKMTEKYMTDFMFYHNYTSASGIMALLAGLLSAAVAIQGFINGNMQNGLVWTLCTILFLVVNPHTLKSRAKAQVQNSEMFKKPLEYEFTDEGITVRQDEMEATTKWDEIAKAVSTNQSVILYLNRVRALIFPKECMGEQYVEVLKMIHTHMPPKRVKIRGV